MKINDYSNSMQNYYLNNAQNSANKALDNISANRAISGSDSANMVIANALLSNANAISQGVSNANDAIGVLQIADGALQNLTNGADRLNELSIRSTSLAMDSNANNTIAISSILLSSRFHIKSARTSFAFLGLLSKCFTRTLIIFIATAIYDARTVAIISLQSRKNKIYIFLVISILILHKKLLLFSFL